MTTLSLHNNFSVQEFTKTAQTKKSVPSLPTKTWFVETQEDIGFKVSQVMHDRKILTIFADGETEVSKPITNKNFKVFPLEEITLYAK